MTERDPAVTGPRGTNLHKTWPLVAAMTIAFVAGGQLVLPTFDRPIEYAAQRVVATPEPVEAPDEEVSDSTSCGEPEADSRAEVPPEPDPGDACPPPPAPDEGVSRVTTPEGLAAIEVVLERDSIRVGEEMGFQVVNRGEVAILSGVYFDIERWNGEAWTAASWPTECGWPDVGLGLPPGGNSDEWGSWADGQRWPRHGDECSRATWTGEDLVSDDPYGGPGWYRIVKAAVYEDSSGLIDPNIELVARARFQILN